MALLDKTLIELKKHMTDISLDEFSASIEKRWMAERALQMMVEIVIDIANRILAVEKAGPTSTASESILKLVQLGVLSDRDPYRNMIKFRNLIVHDYEEIDPAVLYDIIDNHLDDFRKFQVEIDAAQESK